MDMDVYQTHQTKAEREFIRTDLFVAAERLAERYGQRAEDLFADKKARRQVNEIEDDTTMEHVSFEAKFVRDENSGGEGLSYELRSSVGTYTDIREESAHTKETLIRLLESNDVLCGTDEAEELLSQLTTYLSRTEIPEDEEQLVYGLRHEFHCYAVQSSLMFYVEQSFATYLGPTLIAETHIGKIEEEDAAGKRYDIAVLEDIYGENLTKLTHYDLEQCRHILDIVGLGDHTQIADPAEE